MVKKILRILNRLTGDQTINDDLITHVQDRLGHDRRYAIDASKIKRELGWVHRVPFDDGIEETVRWYLEHPDWMAHVISGEYTRFYEKNYQNR